MFAAVSLLVLILALLAGTAPSFFGYETFVVLSGSMEPTISVGDLAVVGPAQQNEFMVGDIITYRTAERPDIIVTHRLVGIEMDDRGRLAFQTKGDANNTVDRVLVEQNAVLGKVAYTVPKVGYLVEFSKQPQGKVFLIGVPGFLLAVDSVLSVRRRRRQGEIQPALSEAGELVARGRVALQNGAVNAAATLFDQAIAADPHLDDAWLLKAECLPEGAERMACLRAGLMVNPGSARLREAVERETVSGTAAG